MNCCRCGKKVKNAIIHKKEPYHLSCLKEELHKEVDEYMEKIERNIEEKLQVATEEAKNMDEQMDFRKKER